MHVRKMYVIKDVIIKGKHVSQKCTCAGYLNPIEKIVVFKH